VAKKRQTRGARKTSPAKQLKTEEPLYAELGEIGRLLKPLDPASFLGRESLHTCPAVKLRAGNGATPAQLAYHAREALKDAIDSITTTRDSVIAHAIFGLGKFDGLSIGKRQEILKGDPYNVSIDIYKDHRPKVLGKIIVYLSNETPTDKQQPRVLTTHPLPVHKLYRPDKKTADANSDLARSAARFYYAGLASLFAAKLDAELIADRISIPHHDIAACEINAFETYAALGTTDIFDTDDPEPYTVIERFCEEDCKSLMLLTQTIRQCDPFTPAQRDTLEIHSLGLWGQLTTDGNEARVIYNTTWHDWYKHNAHEGTASAPSGLEILTAKAGAIGLIYGGAVGYEEPVLVDARRIAHTVLAQYYDFDEWAPLLEGRSLRDYAASYFDSIGPRLANSDLVWYGNNNEA